MRPWLPRLPNPACPPALPPSFPPGRPRARHPAALVPLRLLPAGRPPGRRVRDLGDAGGDGRVEGDVVEGRERRSTSGGGGGGRVTARRAALAGLLPCLTWARLQRPRRSLLKHNAARAPADPAPPFPAVPRFRSLGGRSAGRLQRAAAGSWSKPAGRPTRAPCCWPTKTPHRWVGGWVGWSAGEGRGLCCWGAAGPLGSPCPAHSSLLPPALLLRCRHCSQVTSRSSPPLLCCRSWCPSTSPASPPRCRRSCCRCRWRS